MEQAHSDAELLEKFTSGGDMEALGVLYKRYIPLVYGLSLRYLGEQAAAQDAVMDVFEHIAANVARFEVRDFRTWLYSVARNHALGVLRRKNPEKPADFAASVMETAFVVHLLEGEGEEERLRALSECMEKLPPRQRESIRLFFYEKQSYADIEKSTKYDYNSVKSYIQNGKRNLKNCIEHRLETH